MEKIATAQDYAEGLVEHAERLAVVATWGGKGEACARDVEVKKIAGRCAELVRGASALGAQNNQVAVAVIGRTMVESLILILWVCVSEENAIHQSQAGLAEFTKAARINMQKGNLKIRDRESGEDATAEFLKTDRFQKLPKQKRVSELATEAGVEDLYDVFYRFKSLATHGHDMMGNEEDPELGLIVDLQAIGAMCKGVGHVGVKWLLGRVSTDNEALRQVLGIGG